MTDNKNMKIGIIGAGPSGLAAAEALREKGYKNVTVIEKKDRVGGMALSLTYETPDKKKIIYEVGSLQPVSSSILYRLIEKYGLHVGKNVLENKSKSDHIYLKLYSLKKHKPILDYTKNKFGYPLKYFFSYLLDLIKLSWTLFKYRKLAKPGFNISQQKMNELSVTCDQWVTNMNFKLIDLPMRMLSVTLTMGNVTVKSDIPVVVLLKLIYQVRQAPYSRLRYVNGLHVLIREGYQELWNRVAKQHHVLLNINIHKIIRRKEIVIVETDYEKLEFEKIIITCSPTQALYFLDSTEVEKNLFEKVHYSPGWRIAFLAKYLPHDAVYSFIEPYLEENYGPFLQGFYPEGEVEKDVWLYSAGLSLNKFISIEPYLKSAEKMLREQFNAEVIEWITPTFWPEYVPHFSPSEVRKGIYPKLADLQGKNNTYYCGGAFCGNSHATVAEYSYDLVDKFF